MIKVLLVEDSVRKLKDLRSIIDSIPEKVEFEIAHDTTTAKRFMAGIKFDLMILDLCLPTRTGDDPSPENGKDLLIEIGKSLRLNKPFHIIGLTEYKEYIEKYSKVFDNFLWALLEYSDSHSDWSDAVKTKIEYLVSSKREILNPSMVPFQFDLAIVTALRDPELTSILRLPANWEKITIPGDPSEYYKGIFQNEDNKVTVVCSASLQMGMVSSALQTGKMIRNFRPKIIAMTGIAGGVEKKGNLGDIICTELSFDYGSGKIKTIKETEDSKFEPDYKPIPLKPDLLELMKNIETSRKYLNDIKSNWPADSPEFELKLRVGPLATGAGVIENKKIIEDITAHSRKLTGIDMETYGVFYAAENSTKPKP